VRIDGSIARIASVNTRIDRADRLIARPVRVIA
jgi:hypothetical protein